MGAVIAYSIELILVSSNEDLIFLTWSYNELFHLTVLEVFSEVYFYLVEVGISLSCVVLSTIVGK